MMPDRFITLLIMPKEVCIERAMSNNFKTILSFILEMEYDMTDIIKCFLEVEPTCTQCFKTTLVTRTLLNLVSAIACSFFCLLSVR